MTNTIYNNKGLLDFEKFDELIDKLQNASVHDLSDLSSTLTDHIIFCLEEEWTIQTSLPAKQCIRKRIKAIADQYNTQVHIMAHIACKLLIEFAAKDDNKEFIENEKMLYKKCTDNIRFLSRIANEKHVKE